MLSPYLSENEYGFIVITLTNHFSEDFQVNVNYEPVIIADEQQREQFLNAVLIQSQMLETPIEKNILQDKLAGLEPGNWSLELLRALKEFDFKAKWAKYDPAEKKAVELPQPFIAKMDGQFIIIMKHNDKELLTFSMEKKRTVIITIGDFQKQWDGEVFLMSPKLKLSRLPSRFNLQWFLPVFWKFKRFFYEVLIASCLLQIFTLITPLFTQVIIDKVLVHKGLSTLDVLMTGLIIIAVFQMVLGFLRTYIFTVLTNKVDVVLGARLYNHIVSLPLRYFESRRVGETVARVKELETIRSFISGSSLVLIIDTAFCFIFIIAMFWYSPILCLVAIALIPFMVLLNLIATPIYRKRIQTKFEANAESQSFLVESVTGAATVKSLALEQRFTRRWEDLLGRYVKTSFDVNHVANAANSLGGFLQQLSTLFILWTGAHLVMDGKLSVGQLVAFQMLAGQVSGPVLRLVSVWQQFQQTRISIDRIGDIMNLPKESDGRGEMSPIRRGEIFFEKVSFRYNHDEPQVVKNINVKLEPGVMVGIVGPSGSGKSTLIKLLQRMYDLEEGRIFVDNIDISKYNPTAYRRQIGTVLQENYLFCGTVRENIAIARPGATMEEIEMAARMSGAHDFIVQMKAGYDTVIGERGDSLSGGQRQKIAISRAILVNPRILIFDEATSALDALSEKDVLDSIQKVRKGRTVLMIAHRLAAVQKADVILVMNKGSIVEYGTHAQLMKLDGMYAAMYREQEGTHA